MSDRLSASWSRPGASAPRPRAGPSSLRRRARRPSVDGLQRSLVVAVPVVRGSAHLPTVAARCLHGFSSAVAVLTGTRELRVISSLVAHRIEETAGRPADPALVKKLATELYLAPKRFSHLSDRRIHPGRLLRHRPVRGAFGGRNEKAAVKALETAKRLEMQTHLARWAEMNTSSARAAGWPRRLSADGSIVERIGPPSEALP